MDMQQERMDWRCYYVIFRVFYDLAQWEEIDKLDFNYSVI